MWNDPLARPFPDVGDLTADLAGYDGDLAGLVQRVMHRQTLPSPIAIDHRLTERIRETGHDEAIDYVEHLNDVAALAPSLHEERA
jgi:hypothetical protein